MCGISGFSGKNTFNNDKIIQLMMWNAFERGMDATGVYSPKNNLLKTTDHAADFLTVNHLIPDTLLMSHVRAATVGDKTKSENAHPFQYNGITLLHNGTLKNHWDLTLKYGFAHKDFNVDSQAIAGIIGQELNFNVLSEIDGPAAFLIHNQKTPDILYAFRNTERPLFRGLLGEDMYISSIKDSLKLIGCTKIKEFKANYLYAIKDGKIIDYKSVKNTPYYKYVNTASTVYREIYPANLYFNTNLKLKRLGYWEKGLTLNQTYLVEGFNLNTQYLTVKGDDGSYHDVSKFDFYYENKAIVENCYVRCLTDLVLGSGKDEVKIASKDDYFMVTGVNHIKGFVRAFKLDNRTIDTTIPKNLLERVDEEEEVYIIDTFSSKEEETQLELKFIESDYKDLIIDDIDLSDISDIVNLPEANPKNEEDVNYIVVDQDELVSDFINIEDCYEKLFKYVSPFLNEEAIKVIQKQRTNTMNDLSNIAEKHKLLINNNHNGTEKKLIC